MAAREHQGRSKPLGGGRPHPRPKIYLMAALALTALTAEEITVYYVKALQNVVAGIFMLGTVAELSLVAMFYMHLRYDSRLFAGLFVFGLLVAVSIALVLMALFGVI